MNLKDDLKKLKEDLLAISRNYDVNITDRFLRKVLNIVADGIYVESLGMYDFREEIAEILKIYKSFEKRYA